MEFGWMSILPPIIAIGLALLTKEVISSLLIGIFAGALIFNGGSLIATLQTIFDLMSVKMGDNASMIIFLALLGALVVVVTKAGGSKAYGNWAATKIKSRSGALLSTSILGSLIFIDDYFNCLTVGTVMKPVTDKFKISRAKLAYIIDSTAAPICIIAPVSSWAASVVATIADVGVNDSFNVFMATIPFNLYAILTICMVIYMCFSTKEIGPMRKFEADNSLCFENNSGSSDRDIEVSDKGRVSDLIIPILSLIVFTVLSMLYTGGFFSGEGVTLAGAFGDCSVNMSLCLGGFGGLIVAFVMFIPRKLLTFKEYMESITEGVKSMVGAIMILILAWSIGGICSSDYLNTGGFIGDLLGGSNMALWILPAITFVVAGALAFSTGTAWGTFGILVPIMVPVIINIGAEDLLVVMLAAIFSGSVFGDHCSPISDTTILSSAGAGCHHIDHVSSQIPYALMVAASCFVGFIVAGITKNALFTLAASVIALVIITLTVQKVSCKNN